MKQRARLNFCHAVLAAIPSALALSSCNVARAQTSARFMRLMNSLANARPLDNGSDSLKEERIRVARGSSKISCSHIARARKIRVKCSSQEIS